MEWIGLFIWWEHDHIPLGKMNEMNWKTFRKSLQITTSKGDSIQALSLATISDFCLKVQKCDEILLKFV